MSGRTQSQHADLSIALKIVFACMATASIALLGLAFGQGSPSEPRASAENRSGATVGAAVPQLTCPSGLIGSGDFDVVGPTTAAEAKTWPQTPTEAVNSLKLSALAPSAAARGALTLGKKSEVVTEDGVLASEYVATNVSGSAVIRVRVEDVGFGAYAITQIERCAG